MSFREKLISNTTYLFFDWVFTSLISLFYWFIIGKTFLPFQYGIIATSTQIAIMLSGISMLGLNSAAIKLIPELIKKKQQNKIPCLIRYSIKIILPFLTCIAIFLIIFSRQLSPILNLETKVIWITAISTIMVSLAVFFGNVLQGFQDMKKLFMTDLYGQITKIIIVLLLLFFDLLYFGPLIAFFSCYLIIFLTRFKMQFLKNEKYNINKKIIRKYFIPAFIVVVLSILFTQTQYIILTLLIKSNLTPSEVMTRIGYFAIAMTISFPIQVIPNILSSALFPITSELSVDKNEKQKQAYLIKLIFRYSLFFVLPVAVFLILTSNHIIIFFSKPEYLSATKILPILVIASVFWGLGNIFLSSLYALRKPRKYRNCFLTIVLLYFSLAIPLAYYFFEIGLAISYFISTLFLLLFSFLLLKKYLKIGLPIKDTGRIILATVISSIFLLLFKQFIPNIWLAGVFVGIASLVYLLILLFTGFYIEEDLKVLDFLAKKSPIFKKKIISLRKLLLKRVSRSYLKAT